MNNLQPEPGNSGAICRNCSGTGRINDTVCAAITHRSKTVSRRCRYCTGTGRLVPVAPPAQDEIGEIPAWMLGEDEGAADDELLNRLGSATPGTNGALVDDELNALLLAWRYDSEAEPLPDLVDVATAIATIQRGAA